jgi:alpha-mannosidase
VDHRQRTIVRLFARLLQLALFVTLALWLFAPEIKAAAATQELVFVIPHTHWEGAVFKTREEYLEVGLPHILKALYLLKKYPNYRFVLDQMCYVRPFLERYPYEAAAFQRFLSEGRLQIAGGTDTMHDNNIPSGESIVRQYLIGKSFFREKLGYDVTTGWALDTFGHNAQMPQILKLAGMKSYWFQRGVPNIETPSEFLWQGLDGTQIPAFWLPLGYGTLNDISRVDPEFSGIVRSLFDSLTPYSHGRERVLMAGADVWEPEELLPVMIDKFNSSHESPFTLRLGIPSDYEMEVSKRTDRPVVRGELNPVFQGTYSSRIEVKQAMRDMERLLTLAEKLSVMAGVLGAPSHSETIDRAWEPVLFNQAHDLSSGVMVDKVYEDSMQRYERARSLVEDTVRMDSASIITHIDTSGRGVPVAVFNVLGWPRTDETEVEFAFSDSGVRNFALFDSDGASVPIQILNTIRNDDGSIRQARIAFIASNIPAFGYAIYHAVQNADGPVAGDIAVHNSMREDRGSIENEFYRASFNLWTGEMTSLILKENNWEVLAAPGNVVAREYDGGDFWELYGTLNGGRLTAMKKEVLLPRPSYTQFSSDFVGGSGATHIGPVFSEFRIEHLFGKNQFATRVRMYEGLRRIDISNDLVNEEPLVRYRVLFPTSIPKGTATYEIPFGAIARPQRQEFPAQNWIDYGDGGKGLALINRGLPGNNVADGELMLSLMRSARLISYGYSGGYEPGVGSDTGLGIGKKYTLEYAVLPHTGDWRTAALWRPGMELNNPLIATTVAPHSGELPARWGMLEIGRENVVASALKQSKDGATVLRVYEAAGKQASGVRVRLHVHLKQLHEANLIEDSGAQLKSEPDSFTFNLKPFEIRTFKLSLDALGRRNALTVTSRPVRLISHHR